jgi:FkbM family methyltransferase
MNVEDGLPYKLRVLIFFNKVGLLKYIKVFLGRYLNHKIKKLKKLQFQEIQSFGRFAKLKLGTYEFILDRSKLHDFQMLLIIKDRKMYEPEVTSYINEYLKAGQTFMDIGANNGYYTLIASQIIGDLGKVISIEPNPTALKRLEQNVLENEIKNVSIFKIALSDFNGYENLYLNNEDEDNLTSLIPNIEKMPTSKVEVRKFDDLFKDENIDLIKMDVEGSEISIIRGMNQYLKTHQNINIIMEWNPLYRNEDDYIYLSSLFNIYLLSFKSNLLRKIRINRYNELPPILCNLLLERK